MKPGHDSDPVLLAHGYLGLDTEVVWSVVEHDLLGLAQAVQRMRLCVNPEATNPN
jgi:uncharacterized protein with HEPN domain